MFPPLSPLTGHVIVQLAENHPKYSFFRTDLRECGFKITARCLAKVRQRHSNDDAHLYRSTYMQTGKNSRAHLVHFSRFSVSATKRDENLVVYIFLIYNLVQDALAHFVISRSPQSSPKQAYSVHHRLPDKILSLTKLHTLAVGFTMRLA